MAFKGGGRRRIKGRYNQRLPSVSFALGLYISLNVRSRRCYQGDTVFFRTILFARKPSYLLYPGT
jgi:hypothetical protein